MGFLNQSQIESLNSTIRDGSDDDLKKLLKELLAANLQNELKGVSDSERSTRVDQLVEVIGDFLTDEPEEGATLQTPESVYNKHLSATIRQFEDSETATDTLKPEQANTTLKLPTSSHESDSKPDLSDQAESEGIIEFGDYVLLEELARGGMGVVYKARQRSLNRLVAVKMILSGQFASEDDRERFYSEAEAAANLNHDNIVTIYEVGELGGQHYFSMELVEGGSLSDLINEHPLEAREAAMHGIAICNAIQSAHDNGILHRDIKPGNVMLDTSGKPMVTDFGLAKSTQVESTLTLDGAPLGTPSYMPPEQARGDSEAISIQSDIYSVGATIYELITGSPPFQAAAV